MVLLDKLWDDVLAGPHPDQGLDRLRKLKSTRSLTIKDGEGKECKYQRSMSMPAIPETPTTVPGSRKENVWRSVFNPGRNHATKGIGAQVFDKPNPNSPTVYDWLYSEETRSKHRVVSGEEGHLKRDGFVAASVVAGEEGDLERDGHVATGVVAIKDGRA
ncbi:hypothetical protein HHK36_023624 [Tetracentron sinense]|uniref:Uncharacterized protein n=1 Tax=Tetracentron sinense TaxID=13715 RepID=A0A834YQG5_TETSI|nr:hypothetical protein HHK36_023624 [Tetracentron sinense]